MVLRLAFLFAFLCVLACAMRLAMLFAVLFVMLFAGLFALVERGAGTQNFRLCNNNMALFC